MGVIYAIAFYAISNTQYCSTATISKSTYENSEDGITVLSKRVDKLQDDVITLSKIYEQKKHGKINFAKLNISLSYKQFQFKSVSLKRSTLSRYRATRKDYHSAFLMLERYDETIQSNLNAIKIYLEDIITSLDHIIGCIGGANVSIGPRFNEKEIVIATKVFINSNIKTRKDGGNIEFHHKIICYAIVNQFSNFILKTFFMRLRHICSTIAVNIRLTSFFDLFNRSHFDYLIDIYFSRYTDVLFGCKPPVMHCVKQTKKTNFIWSVYRYLQTQYGILHTHHKEIIH